MIYNDRVQLVKEVPTEEPDFLTGKPIMKSEMVTVPCQCGGLSHNQQIGMFGGYNVNAFKLHLQGRHDNIEEVVYNSQRRVVSNSIFHRNSTVLVIK